MGILHCLTPQMNEKEVWVFFLAYNLIRLLMCEAGVFPRQISFKHTLQVWVVPNAVANYRSLRSSPRRMNPILRILIYIGEPVTQPRMATARAPPDWLDADIDQTNLNESEQA
jgi:hypothetical protein